MEGEDNVEDEEDDEDDEDDDEDDEDDDDEDEEDDENDDLDEMDDLELEDELNKSKSVGSTLSSAAASVLPVLFALKFYLM